MSYHNNAKSFDSLLLQSLMGRLQLRPQYLDTNSHLSQSLDTNSYISKSLEDFLLGTNSLIDDDDNDPDTENPRTLLAKEESMLEKDIIRVILSGKTETLKPNSGQAVSIGEHYICVGFHQEIDSDYRVWEWHGHIMLFDEENGYTPEYIYGNYFERLLGTPNVALVQGEKKVNEEKGGNSGLRELIDGDDSITGRILRRHLNAGSIRF